MDSISIHIFSAYLVAVEQRKCFNAARFLVESLPTADFCCQLSLGEVTMV
jgi:hypothetical protein